MGQPRASRPAFGETSTGPGGLAGALRCVSTDEADHHHEMATLVALGGPRSSVGLGSGPPGGAGWVAEGAVSQQPGSRIVMGVIEDDHRQAPPAGSERAGIDRRRSREHHTTRPKTSTAGPSDVTERTHQLPVSGARNDQDLPAANPSTPRRDDRTVGATSHADRRSGRAKLGRAQGWDVGRGTTCSPKLSRNGNWSVRRRGATTTLSKPTSTSSLSRIARHDHPAGDPCRLDEPGAASRCSPRCRSQHDGGPKTFVGHRSRAMCSASSSVGAHGRCHFSEALVAAVCSRFRCELAQQQRDGAGRSDGDADRRMPVAPEHDPATVPVRTAGRTTLRCHV
jgi:hypothetical protein